MSFVFARVWQARLLGRSLTRYLSQETGLQEQVCVCLSEMAACRLLRSSLKSSIPLLSRGRSAVVPVCLSQQPRRYLFQVARISSCPAPTKFAEPNLLSGKLQSATQRIDLHTTAFRIYREAAAKLPWRYIAAVLTGVGGIILTGVGWLYKERKSDFWEQVDKRLATESVLLLPQQPSHSLQHRKDEVRSLRSMFISLRKENGKDTAVTVYITGIPGCGKTQLAREYGEEYYHKGFLSTFVGSVDAYSVSSLLWSYDNLASKLGCASEVSGIDELQRLELLSAAVGKELKKRPGWLLIVDNLSSDVKSVAIDRALASNIPTTTENLPKAARKPIWPHLGDKSWGKGYVLVTTRDRNLIESASPFAKELSLSEGMSEADAIALLEKVSGLKGEEAVEVVNSLDRVPLSVASAGLYIRGLEKCIKKLLQDKNTTYPVFMTTAVSRTARQLATDPNLYKVFLLLATCALSPVPMSLVARILGVSPDLNSVALESVRNCVFLLPSQSATTEHGVDKSLLEDEIETLSLHGGTQEIFRELFLGESTPPSDPSIPHMETRNDLFCHFVDCLLQEYEMAVSSSYELSHLLLPHMEAHLKALDTISVFHLDSHREMSLCCYLGECYQLVGRLERSREVLERALRIYEASGARDDVFKATIVQLLGMTYRDLGMQKESEINLKEALGIYEQECGEVSNEVAITLYELSITYEQMGLNQESIKCLERALEIYESLYTHSWTNNPHHILYIVATLSKLGMIYTDLGQPQKSIELLQRALEINKHVLGPDNIYVTITLSQLSVAYHRLGDVHKSEQLAEEALRKIEAIHGPAHPDMVSALNFLGLAYAELGQPQKSVEVLQRALEINKQVYGGGNHIEAVIEHLKKLCN